MTQILKIIKKKCYNKPKANKNDIKIGDHYEHFNTLLEQDPDGINVMNNDDNLRKTDDNELDANITEQE